MTTALKTNPIAAWPMTTRRNREVVTATSAAE